MFLVAIAWLYVTVLMALTETTVARGIVTFLVYGAFPLSIVMYLMSTPARRRRRRALEAQQAQDAACDPHARPDPHAPPDDRHVSAASIASAPAATAPQAMDDAPGSIQTQAASRPVTPSRRNE